MRSFTNLVWKPFGGAEPHRSMTFIEYFSSKKFSRVVVYCSVIKVPVVLFSRQLWYFIKSLSLCQELFLFSVSLIRFPFGPLQATACIYYHIAFLLSTTFLLTFPLNISVMQCLFLKLWSFVVSIGFWKNSCSPPVVPPPRLRSVSSWFFFPHQRQVLSYHCQ